MLLVQIKTNKRYAGSSNWTVSVRYRSFSSTFSYGGTFKNLTGFKYKQMLCLFLLEEGLIFCLFLQEVAECVKNDFGSIDILVHSLANGPEVRKILIMEFLCATFHAHNL